MLDEQYGGYESAQQQSLAPAVVLPQPVLSEAETQIIQRIAELQREKERLLGMMQRGHHSHV
ncbi:hypothetical protein GGI07_005905 [Coemansia sp. Benny D115]|nr:hypothetical protein GGI07_005905 [Coemansia sp. Benny D115]